MAEQGEDLVSEILAEMAPRVVTTRVLFRQDLLNRHDELEAELAREIEIDARENRNALGPGIAKQITELEDEIEAAKREFAFASIGRTAWTKLVGKYPPTKEQLKNNRSLAFNPEKLPAAAIAETSHDPVLTLEQALHIEAVAPDGVFEQMWGAVCQANVSGSDTPKSLAAGMIRRLSGESAITAAPEV